MAAQVIAFKVEGFRNPALCVLEVLRGTLPQSQRDDESFERMALECGDAPPEALNPGFVVRGIEDVSKLCRIGGFEIRFIDGRCTCLREPK